MTRLKRMDMTPTERSIITQLKHPLYTVEFIEEWANKYSDTDVDLGKLEALQCMAARGYLDAIRLVAERVDSDVE